MRRFPSKSIHVSSVWKKPAAGAASPPPPPAGCGVGPAGRGALPPPATLRPGARRRAQHPHAPRPGRARLPGAHAARAGHGAAPRARGACLRVGAGRPGERRRARPPCADQRCAREPRSPLPAARRAGASHDGLPEPLCAIYEPRSRAPLAAYVAAGKQCPRKFLLGVDTLLLDEPNPRALDNINTPEEYGSAMATLTAESSATTRHITVQYFALLREQAGRREEALVSAARTPRELYAELAARYPFTLAPDVLRVAINAEFSEWSTPLADGDAVVFIPPVAGG